MSFLIAQWKKLILVNYEVDSSTLLPFLPYKTELDIWQNKCYVSLVGFKFVDTKMLGLKIPFHINFEEVNLRFYVRHLDQGEWKRGVVFIKEIVPKHAITIVANTLYKEHYETCSMKHDWLIDENNQHIEYQWKKNKQWQILSVDAETKPLSIPPNSEAEFITEHYWGYTKINKDKTFEYEVKHPRWQHFKVKNFKIEVDFGLNYGSSFKFLNEQIPTSVMLAEGSEISVENKKTI